MPFRKRAATSERESVARSGPDVSPLELIKNLSSSRATGKSTIRTYCEQRDRRARASERRLTEGENPHQRAMPYAWTPLLLNVCAVVAKVGKALAGGSISKQGIQFSPRRDPETASSSPNGIVKGEDVIAQTANRQFCARSLGR